MAARPGPVAVPHLQVLPAQSPNHVAKLRAVCLGELQQQRRRQQHRVVRQPSGSQPAVAGIGPGCKAAKAWVSESDRAMAMAAVLPPSAVLAEPAPVQVTPAHWPARFVELAVPAGATERAMLLRLPLVLAGSMSVMGRTVASQLPVMLTEPVPARAMLP